MNLRVRHEFRGVQTGSPASLALRRKRRRCCSTCRTFIRKRAIRCHYCGQHSITRWHLLLLGALMLIMGLLLLNGLNG